MSYLDFRLKFLFLQISTIIYFYKFIFILLLYYISLAFTFSRGNVASNKIVNKISMAIDLPPLPYDYKALEPHIGEQVCSLYT